MKFLARFLPRDFFDLAVSILVGSIQAAALFVLPFLMAFFIAKSVLMALLAPIIIYGIFTLYSVRFVMVDAKGITFSRMLGYSKFLAWPEVKNICLAPRRELIWHGWLWPLLPAREMTTSLSSLGHYRISWNGGYCYFPPKDTQLFEAAVSGHLKSLGT